MDLSIGENIKRLRRERCITQETLAQVLNISPQSVSKWERNDAYPDIVMLPAIANYFNVTVDVLLGNDKTVMEKKIRNYIDECYQLTEAGELQTREKALTTAKRAYEEFPYDFRIVMLYVNMLDIYGTKNDREEIMRLCGLVVDECTDEALLSDAKAHLHGLISPKDKMDFLKKYIQYGQNWDWFKVYPVSTDEGKILFQHEISDKWWHLNAYIGTYYDDFNPEKSCFTHEEKIKLIRKQEKIFYAFFDEDDLGEYTFYVGQYNEFLAYEYAALGMAEEALDCMEKAADGWIAYNNLPEEYTYTNILIHNRPYLKSDLGGSYSLPSQYLQNLEENPVFDELRNNERYEKICEKLRKL